MDGWIQKIFPNCDILLNAAAHSRAERKQTVFKRAKTLRARKAGDSTRSREFFGHSLTHLLPLKRGWLLKKQKRDIPAYGRADSPAGRGGGKAAV